MIEKTLINKLKKIKGSILGIGIESIDVLKTIDKSKKITYCDLLLSETLDEEDGKGRLKRVKFKKLKKYYKYSSINTTIACFDKIPYKRSFIKNSVYITKDNIYLYSNLDNEYIDTYGIPNNDEYIFAAKSNAKQPMTLETINVILRRIEKHLQLPYNLSAFSLRRTFVYWQIIYYI